MSELRQDIATKRWVIVARERAKRPHEFVKPKPAQEEPEHSDTCPFCSGNEGKTPPEVFAVREGSEPNAAGWQVRVVPNRFAALSPGAALQVAHPDVFTTISGFGAHEVVVETPIHNQTLATLPPEQVERVLFAVLQRLWTLAQDTRLAMIAVFRNHGAAAGTSLAHPHSQLIAMPTVPTDFRSELEEARRFYDDRVHCVYCYMLEKELEAGERVVFETPRYVVLTPFASRFPFEMILVPREHRPSISWHARAQDIAPLAATVRRMLSTLHRAANNPDYNLVVHSAPLRDSCEDYYHWHIEVLPRLTTPAGFEMGTGIYITTAVPEESAAFLREYAKEEGTPAA